MEKTILRNREQTRIDSEENARGDLRSERILPWISAARSAGFARRA